MARNRRKSPTGRLRLSEPEIQVLPPVRPPARIIMHAKVANQQVADIRNVIVSDVKTDRDGNLHVKVDEIIDVTSEPVPAQCPACGGPNHEVCKVLGHIYPIKRLTDGKKNS